MSGDEWGPWIAHDGKGCPCIGAMVRSEDRRGSIEEHIAGGMLIFPDGSRYNGPRRSAFFCAWVWDDGGPLGLKITRYQIKKPRGLTILEGLLESLPEPERVDA